MKRIAPTAPRRRSLGPQDDRPRIAFVHPELRLGAVAATCLWAIEALKTDYAVTLITGKRFDLEALNQAFGTAVMPWDFELHPVPVLSEPSEAADNWQHFSEQVRAIAGDFDLCVTLGVPLDCGRPAVHLISEMPQWIGEMHTPVRRRWGLGSRNPMRVEAPAGLLAANSRYTAREIELVYGVKPAVVLPPPVHLPTQPLPCAEERLPGSFLMLGHFTADKRVDSAVRILSDVRAMGHHVSLHLAGIVPDDEAGDQIRSMAAENTSWITLHGPVAGVEKDQLLRSCAYGLNCHLEESFGLAVAEMAASGCLPMVPIETGAAEIVGHELFTWRSPIDAAEKIDHLLRCPWQRIAAEAYLQERAQRYTPQRFTEGLKLVVGSALSLVSA